MKKVGDCCRLPCDIGDTRPKKQPSLSTALYLARCLPDQLNKSYWVVYKFECTPDIRRCKEMHNEGEELILWSNPAFLLRRCVVIRDRPKICKMMKLIPERKATETSHLSKPHIFHGVASE